MAAVAPPPAPLPLGSGSRPTSASSMKNEPKDEKPAVAVATAPPAVDLEVTEPTPVVGGAEGKEADAAAKSPQNSTAQPVAAPGSPNPQRPPIRPNVAVRSKFELEPNPFEQSFSRSSHHSSSSLSEDREQRGKTPPRGGDATSIKHHALPPLSSLTSPAAADPSQFPWLANQSLRTGPLSPAMLAGPTQAGNHQASSSTLRPSEGTVGQNDQPFDGTTFRTGFTPGTGSGFTPGYNSLMNGTSFGALPMPSPNTAAFLNMVTNSTPLGEGETGAGQGQDQNQAAHSLTQPPSAIPPHMQSHHGLSHLAPADAGQDTITPNTLSALTGVFNDMNRQQVQAQHPGQMNPSHPPMHGPAAGQTHPTYYPMHGPAPPPLPQAHHAHPHSHMAGMGMPPPPHIDYAQQSANAASQAANGLFLLSQAHQELSKREEERGGPTNPVAGAGTGPGAPLMGKRTSVGSVPPGSGKPPLSAGMSAGGGGSGTGVGQKRKSDTISGSALTSGGTGKGAKKGKKNAGGAAAVNIDNSPTNSNGRMGAGRNGSSVKDESASPAFGFNSDGEDEDGYGGGNGLNSSGRPETEEEKRKNFLERNRQAALKCRQRKKAWLTELQVKVEGLTVENENLQRTVAGLHEEVARLTGVLMQHRDCGIGMQGGYGRPIR